MADESNDRFSDRDESDNLKEVRQALEAVERRQDDAARERRRLSAQLDGLLTALREEAIVLFFDSERELAEAKGPLKDQLGASAAELLANFDDFADEETLDALDEANKAVLDDEATGACVSDGFLRSEEEDLAVTFIHLRRHDEDGELLGTEVIGLVAPVAEPDEDLDEGPDPFEMLIDQVGRRLLDDAGEASVARAVQTFGDFLLADRVVVNRYDEAARSFSAGSSWLRGDTRPLAAEERGISISEVPWAYSALGAGEAVVISEDTELPPDARKEKDLYAGDGVKSSLLVPMVRRDALIGFVSIQSAREPRKWGDTDVARARQFARLLAATLARAEVEAERDRAREDAEQAAAKREQAEARAEEAEQLAKRASQELDEAEKEADSLRDKLKRLEDEADEAREHEKEARREADEARDRLDGRERDADTARSELETLKADAERAQRRSEDAAADALAVRKELEEVREQLADALRDAAELRSGGAPAAGAGFAAPERDEKREEKREAKRHEEREEERKAKREEEREEKRAKERQEEVLEIDADEADEKPAPWSSRPQREDGFDPDATIEMKSEDLGRSFDPDATLEIDALRKKASEAAAKDEKDEGAEPAGVDDEDLPRAVGLDATLEDTEAEADEEPGKRDEEGPEKWKDDKTSWEDRTDEVDLPEFLTDLDGDDDDFVEIDLDEESDVEAARRMAREAAGRDEDDDERGSGPPPVILPDHMERTGELDAAAPRDTEDLDLEEVEEPVTLPPLAGIDADVGLEDVGGNVELYRNLLTKFRRDYIGAAAKIDGAIEKGNIEVAHLLLHAVKGVSGVLGALQVRDTADDLEDKLIGKDPSATRASMDAFSGALEEVLEAIGELDRDTGDAGGDSEPSEGEAVAGDEGDGAGSEAHVSDPMVLRSYLSGLRQHLLAEKPRQCMLVMREITARNWPGEYNERVSELAAQIDEGEFEQARETFEDLMQTFTER